MTNAVVVSGRGSARMILAIRTCLWKEIFQTPPRDNVESKTTHITGPLPRLTAPGADASAARATAPFPAAASTIDTLTLLPSGGRSRSIPWAVPTSGDRRRAGSSAPQSPARRAADGNCAPQSPGEGVWAGNSAWESPGQRAAVVNSTLQSPVVGVAIVSCTLQSPVAGVSIVSCTLQSPVVGVAIDDCSLQSSIVGASTVNCRAQLPTPTRRPDDKAPLFASVCPKTAKTGRLLTPAAANQGVLAGHGGTSGTARPVPPHFRKHHHQK
jgi:hypothetical protein